MKCGHYQSILADILCPEPYDHFFEEVVGRRMLHLQQGKAASRSFIIGADPKKTILRAYERLSGTLTCHSGSSKVSPPAARQVSSPGEFMGLVREYHSAGYTVRIPEVTGLSSQLSALCRSVEAVFENPASAVIFWSTAGADAPIHHDEYDIIAIQLYGKKRWFLSNDPPCLPNTWKTAGEGAPRFDSYRAVDVDPGDLLYLPRGLAHTVASTSESIHLAIGFVPVTVRDVMSAAVDYLSEMSRSIRAGVTARADSLSQGDGMKEVAGQLRQGLAHLLKQCESDEFISEAMTRRRARMVENLPKLKRSGHHVHITAASRFRRNPLAMAHFFPTRENVDIRLPGDRILVHPGAEEALRFAIDTPEFRVADLPGALSEEVKIALVARLVSGGYLEPAANFTSDVVSLHHERQKRCNAHSAKKRPSDARPFPMQA